MLSSLHIENIAVIQRADIDFSGGFNVLTGETGAGKSIVIDAIGAILGRRTYREIIRTGAASAFVSAEFEQLPELPWFLENGVGPDEEGKLILQREIREDGKNICRVNGKPLTVAQLRELGDQLLNIHGQHDGQQLMDEEYHLDYLDRFGGTEDLQFSYGESYEQLCGLRRQMRELELDEAEKSRRMDLLAYQISELERAELKPGEEEALSARRNLLRSAGKLTALVQDALAALEGEDGRDGAGDLLVRAERSLAAAARTAEELDPLANALTELREQAQDVEVRLRDLLDEFSFSPQDLDQLESRLDQLYRLRKKYGSTEEEMLSYLERCREELEGLESAGERLEYLARQEAKLLAEAQKRAAALSAARKNAAERLSAAVEEELHQLDMPRARFEVEFLPVENGDGLDASGMEHGRFLLSANAGESLRPLNRVASGGELSRIMLGLKNVLAAEDPVQTLIFDEVDAGVSGRAAQKVAEKLYQAALFKQVLCVTHLPQLAAMADVHFCVEKETVEERTYTRLRRLDTEGRAMELARLTGGSALTETALLHGRDLLSGAQAQKQILRKQTTGRTKR